MDDTAPPRARKSLDDRLAVLTERQQQLEARRQTLLAVKKNAERKRETRRAIIVGGAILAEAKRDPAFAATLCELLDRHVAKKADRAVVADLLQLRLEGL